MTVSRRRFLAVLAGVGSVAGCVGQSGEQADPTDDSTNSATPEETPTPSPTTNSGPASFEVVSTDGPSEVTVGDQLQFSATIRNTGGETGTFEAPLEASVPDRDEWVEQRIISLEVPAGETRTWESNRVTVARENIGTFQFRLGGTTAQWEFTVEPESYAPVVRDVNLIEEWESYGDAVDRAISSAPAGEVITIGWRYEYIVTEGQLHVFEQCRVFDVDSGKRVGNQTYVDRQVYSENRIGSFEHGLDFDTAEWGPGEYRAEVTLRDEVSGEVSNTETTTFELT